MSPVRTGIYALFILVLAGLAGWGVFRVLGGRDDSPVIGAQAEPTRPQALTRDEALAIFDQAIANGRSAVEEFVASGATPCSLPFGGSVGSRSIVYKSLDALINDVDLIVEGDLGASSMLMPSPNTAAAPITTEFAVREVLLGSQSAEAITIGAGGRVAVTGDTLVRTGRPNFDECSGNHVILFLNEYEEAFAVAADGFVSFTEDAADPNRSSELFASAVSIDTLKADIRRMVSDQQDRDLPKGFLVCDAKRASGSSQSPKACPGDSFNPYEAFGLARLLEVDARKRAADGEVLAARADVPTDTPSLLRTLALLDRTVSVEAGDDPTGEVISLAITTTTTGTPPYAVRLKYEAAADVIWLPASGGWFAAPNGFGEALNGIVEGP